MDFLKRMKEEKRVLDEKILKLDSFVRKEKFSELSAEMQDLMTEQLSVMNRYSEILEERINMLNGKELANKGVITNFLEEAVQQHGIDLRIKRVEKIVVGGVIPKEGKTLLPDYEEILPGEQEGKFYFALPVGYYKIEFEEGCNIPNNMMLQIVQRSSVMRCGGIIKSSLFDAGFHTDNMIVFITVNIPMIIEVGARVAQAYAIDCDEVTNLYEGQFQGK